MVRSIIYGYIVQQGLKKRIKPSVIQLPVTGRCNSRCVTCNIWKQAEKKDIDTKALKKALGDPFFSKVHMVGVNGGEPSLLRDLEGLLDALCVLKHLKKVYIITNGLLTDRLMQMMERIRKECLKQRVRVFLTVSVDGIDGIHDTIRGIPDAFEKTMATLKKVMPQKERYCDHLEVGCTVSRWNVACLNEIDVYMQQLNIPVNYHLAVPVRRLHNFEEPSFSVMNDERSRLLAADFFYGQFKFGKDIKHKLRCFLIWKYLVDNGEKRYAACNYLRGDVTITENLDLYLCATASEKVGNLGEESASQLYKNHRFQPVEEKVTTYCHQCAHYMFFPTVKGFLLFMAESVNPLRWLFYRWKALWLK